MEATPFLRTNRHVMLNSTSCNNNDDGDDDDNDGGSVIEESEKKGIYSSKSKKHRSSMKELVWCTQGGRIVKQKDWKPVGSWETFIESDALHTLFSVRDNVSEKCVHMFELWMQQVV